MSISTVKLIFLTFFLLAAGGFITGFIWMLSSFTNKNPIDFLNALILFYFSGLGLLLWSTIKRRFNLLQK